MGLGSNGGNATSKIYLGVAFGKIRQKYANGAKVDETTEGAVKRETQSGVESWAMEHDFLKGIITGVQFKDDGEYGNVFEVTVVDGQDTFVLTFKEDSRNWFDFAKKLPNIKLSDYVLLTPYDFTDKVTGKHRSGFSVKQNGVAVASAYDEKQADGTWKMLHGYPSADGLDWKNKKKVAIYNMDLTEFFVNECKTKFVKYFDVAASEPESAPVPPAIDANGDPLPF